MRSSRRPLMRTKPAGGSWPSLASDQSRPPHSSRRSATEGPSTRGGSSQRGWGWFLVNTSPVASRSCSVSANVGTLTCEDCSCKAHVRSCNSATRARRLRLGDCRKAAGGMKKEGSGVRENASERKSSRSDINANWVWRYRELEDQARKDGLIYLAKCRVYKRRHPGGQNGNPGVKLRGIVEQKAMRKRLLFSLLASLFFGPAGRTQAPPAVQNASGMRLVVADENSYPTLRVVLPGHPDSDKTIEVIFPEHVTVRHVGDTEGKHLFLFQPGQHGDRPAWRQVGRSLQYEKDFAGGLHMLATAMLEDDGVRFSYEFVNRSQLVYEMIYAPTDPRLTSMFHDVRLERTYVHHKDGFDLLASETPSRLTIPLDQWLPARYLASYTWPIPAKKAEKRDNDGSTYYNKSRAVDEPLIATVSSDGKWVVASFTRTTANVWSNPELTCQHVDPQIPLAVGASAAMETKLLVFQGSLDDVLKKVESQRQSLR